MFRPGLTPRLPTSFDEQRGPSGGSLLVVAGVPGTGKSTLADEVGRRLGWPVFSTDWLMGALTPFGGRQLKDLGAIGDELVTTWDVVKPRRDAFAPWVHDDVLVAGAVEPASANVDRVLR